MVLYALWYPRTFAIIDESTYLSTAYVYRAGTIYHDEAGIPSIAPVTARGHRVSKFGPLAPLLFAPFTWISWRAAFVANLALHLAGFVLFLRLVRRARLPDPAALLYLFHPTLLFYSRTLMSDTAAGVLFLAAIVSLPSGETRHRASAVLAGVLAGLSVVARATNVVLVALWLITVTTEDVRRTRTGSPPETRFGRTGLLLAGLLAPAIALAVYHQAAFGVWWRGTAGYAGELGLAAEFGPAFLPSGVLHYGIALLVLYPGMLVAFISDRGRPLREWLPAVGFTFFFCLYYYRERGAGFAETVVTSLRFLIPVLPFFLLSYARSLVRLLGRDRAAAAGSSVALAIAGLGGAALLQFAHDLRLRDQEARHEALYAATTEGATILCDAVARELVHHVRGPRHVVSCERQGTWSFPGVPAGDLYLALVGGDRAGDATGVPTAVTEVLDRCGGMPVGGVETEPPLRVWRLDADAYRSRR